MLLDGMIPTKCPPEQVVMLLLQPAALRELIPEGCEVGERKGDSLPFIIRRKVGPIHLSMAGNLTVNPKPDNSGYDFVAQASHMVAGRFKITMSLRPNRLADNSNNLSWTGQLESQGLTSRLIESRVEQVRNAMKTVFTKLRAQAERA